MRCKITYALITLSKINLSITMIWYIFLTQIWFGECNQWLLKVKSCVMYVGNFYPLMLIYWICQTKSESDLFLYTGFWVQNYILNLCSGAVNLQRLLCSQKAGVKCALKLSGIQNNFPILFIWEYQHEYNIKEISTLVH